MHSSVDVIMKHLWAAYATTKYNCLAQEYLHLVGK